MAGPENPEAIISKVVTTLNVGAILKETLFLKSTENRS